MKSPTEEQILAAAKKANEEQKKLVEEYRAMKARDARWIELVKKFPLGGSKDYDKHSHAHCWNQNQPSACGIALEKHVQCCLCEEIPPEKET